jgi:hypothetical protein
VPITPVNPSRILLLGTRFLVDDGLRPTFGPVRTTATSPPLGGWFAQPQSDGSRDRGWSNGSRTGAAWAASGIEHPGRSIHGPDVCDPVCVFGGLGDPEFLWTGDYP